MFSLVAVQLTDLPPLGIVLFVAILVISLGVHEAAHGWVALKCGDPTARDLGRITLNPLPHIDLFMTIILPTVTYLTTGFPFGGAKPVPVSYYKLRKPLRDMAIVAIAGPAANFLIAIVLFFFMKLLVGELRVWQPNMLGHRVLLAAFHGNLLLAAFNLLPIPPLDGSRVMTWLLPSGIREPYRALERWGLILVFLVMNTQMAQQLVGGTMDLMIRGISSLVTLGGLW